jgi:hypothetical protein
MSQAIEILSEYYNELCYNDPPPYALNIFEVVLIDYVSRLFDTADLCNTFQFIVNEMQFADVEDWIKREPYRGIDFATLQNHKRLNREFEESELINRKK